MAEKGIRLVLSELGGFNESPLRSRNESPSCLNVIGEATGFSVWRGRTAYFRMDTAIGENSHVYAVTWPDGHKSCMVFQNRKIGVLETNLYTDITGSLTFDADKRNPISTTKYYHGRYVCGADYMRGQPWYWDGNIDRTATAIPISHNPRAVCEFGGKLWALGFDAERSLYAWSSGTGELHFDNSEAWEFRDGLASTLVGMRQLSRNLALVWGDRSLWAVTFTGTWPIFTTQIIDMDCDCVSNNSIVYAPGAGYFWQGRNNIWGLVGGQVVDVGVSVDNRRIPRIYDLLRDRPGGNLHLASSVYCRKRHGILFSWPSALCDSTNYPYREPKGLFYRIANGSFWPVSYGVESACEWEHENEAVVIGSDRDGFIYLVDFNANQDKEVSLEWYHEFEWQGEIEKRYKWIRAYLERRIDGSRYITGEFWKDYEKAAQTVTFDTGQEYDALAAHPSWDAGGPADPGAPPDPIGVSEARIGLTGQRLKIKLSNKNGSAFYHGPANPMMAMTIVARSVS